jgi:hypothetical protein
MATPVDIVVVDDSLVPLPVENVVVSFYDPDTLDLVTTATTDGDGEASVSLPDATYEVRSFKRGYAIPVSQIVVDENADTNVFDTVAENLTALPVATDPRLCRCTGVFVNYENRPTPGVTFRVMAKADPLGQTPKTVDSRLVFSSEMAFQTDAEGKVSLDLIRGGEFYVTFSGEDDTTWLMVVPDRSSANLIDLIFPATVSLDWDQDDAPSNAVALAVGEFATVHMSLLFTDFRQRTEELTKWIQLSNSNDTTIRMGFSNDGSAVLIEALEAGTAEITAELLDDLLPIRVPDYSLTTVPLQVTVTS